MTWPPRRPTLALARQMSSGNPSSSACQHCGTACEQSPGADFPFGSISSASKVCNSLPGLTDALSARYQRRLRTSQPAEPVPEAVGDSSDPSGKQTPPSKKLSAEEQLAMYEEELKQNDWGHQPC